MKPSEIYVQDQFLRCSKVVNETLPECVINHVYDSRSVNNV